MLLFKNYLKKLKINRDAYRSILIYFIIANFLTSSVLTVLLYAFSYQKLKTEILKSNKSMLTQLEKGVEVILEEVDKHITQIVLDPSVTYFMKKEDVTQIQTINRLNNIINVNKFIASIYIYYLEEDKVLLVGSGLIPLEEFYDKKLIEETLQGKFSYKWLPARYVEDKVWNIKKDMITVAKPLPLVHDRPKAILYVNINESYIQNMINSISTLEDSNTFIINEQGEFFSHQGKEQLYKGLNIQKYLPKILEGDEGQHDVTINERKEMLSYVEAPKFGMRFVNIYPYKVISDKLFFIKIYFGIIFLINLFLVFFMSAVFAKKTYAPILSIAQLLKVPREGKNKNNIYNMIEDNISELIHEKDELQGKVLKNRPILVNNFIQSLLKGYIGDKEEVKKKLNYYNLDLDQHSYYAVYVMAIDSYKEWASKYNSKQMDMFQVYMNDTLYKVVEQYGVGIIVNMGMNEVAMVVNFSCKEKENAEKYSIQIGETIYQEMSENFAFTVTIGKGNVYGDLSNLNTSYNEAIESLQYSILITDHKLITQSQVQAIKLITPHYPFEKERELLQAVKQGDMGQVKYSLDIIFQNFIDYKQSVSNNSKYILIQLLCSTLQCVYELGIDPSEVFKSNYIFEELLACADYSEAYEWFVRIYEAIGQCMENKMSNQNQELIAKIKEYIEQHYTDNISLSDLADLAYLSVPYLSKLFKEETGYPIKKYITELRMEKAKELLEDTSSKIEVIAQQIGYENVRSFIKAFKNYTALTPGSYRKTLIDGTMEENKGY